MKQPSYIVFLCFGDVGFFDECAFALLSISRLYKPEQLPCKEIWIYTDNPEWFSQFIDCPLPLCFHKITKQEIKEWQGSIEYVYRTKIEVIKNLIHERHGNILYLDTDIVLTHPIDEMLANIENGQAYMHSLEGIINSRATPILGKLDSYLRKNNSKDNNQKSLYDAAMWNSGIIGFNNRLAHIPEAALQLTDNIYPRNHSIRVIEQFAFSIVLQEEGDIRPATPYALHYWNLKEVRIVLASFFNQFTNCCTWDELVQLSGSIQMFEFMMEKLRFEHKRTLWEVLLNRQWVPAENNWEEWKKQLC